MPWLKLEDTARDHPKLFRLAASLKIGTAEARGLITGLWCWALRFAPDGDLGSFDCRTVEVAAEWRGEPGAFTAAAVEAGLLEEDEGRYLIHDWMERQGSYMVAKRQAKRRVTRQSRDSHATVTRQSQGEERRGEEKRGEENKTPPTPPGCPQAVGNARRPGQPIKDGLAEKAEEERVRRAAQRRIERTRALVDRYDREEEEFQRGRSGAAVSVGELLGKG